jgi:hypothetical protein
MEKAVKKISPSDPNNTFVLPATSRVDYLNKICDVLVRKTQTLKELLPNLENATNSVIAILQQNPLLQIAKWKIYISQWMDFYTAFFDESEYLRVGHATREYHVLESARFFASRGKNNANVSNRCNFPTSVLSKAGLEYALWKCQVFLHFQFLFHFIFSSRTSFFVSRIRKIISTSTDIYLLSVRFLKKLIREYLAVKTFF